MKTMMVWSCLFSAGAWLLSTLPDLPPSDHPMRPYTEHVAHRIEWIFWLLWAIFATMIVATGVFVIFARQKYLDRQEDKQRAAVMTELAAASKLLLSSIKVWAGSVEELLKKVKGWTVVQVEKEQEKAEMVVKAAEKVEALVNTVPKDAAKEVINALDARAAGESRG